ncbi:MAG: pantoate--beta-alanine ligase [Verrucomicrobiales bacterium]|nr:pantoate--beta-alanine ligase [Verrucomicrobiales bacterium]
MKTISNLKRMQREAAHLKQLGKKIALVPTMGALHEGHLSLARLARRHGDVVVLSVYVNPKQFGPREDFTKYPRPFARDRRLAADNGVDILFAPGNLYADDASVTVSESVLSQGRCGAFRPGHFDGVATVVAKLFNLTRADAAIFGQKDAQQCDVLERMARDLNFPVEIVRAPIARDADGVARSSRNAYLSTAERQVAARFAAELGKSASVGDARWRLEKIAGLKLQYAEAANGRLCAAVWIGRTRLIDNVELKTQNPKRKTTTPKLKT